MPIINIRYDGELRCTATHEPSGAMFQTDAPKDNQGKGECFSPTDLVAAALGTCMLTIMGIVAKREGIDLRGTEMKVVKEMITQPMRRVGKLTVEFNIPVKVTDEQKQKLINAAHTCPVNKSIHPDIEVPVTFNWG